MDDFYLLPRYPFKRAMLEHAPEEFGVYALFDEQEPIYIMSANSGMTIKTCLLLHQDGAMGQCTMKAAAYTWEITPFGQARAAALLKRFRDERGRDPRCQKAF